MLTFVIDNYVNFAGMCWKIVRIAGDGSIKLILEDKDNTCINSVGNYKIGYGDYGFDSKKKLNYLDPVTGSYTPMVKAFYDFQKSLENINGINYLSKLKSGDWCLNDTVYLRSGLSSPYTYDILENSSNSAMSNNVFYYDSYVRLNVDNIKGYQPTLKCNGTKMNKFKTVSVNDTVIITETQMYVSAITADETIYAGGKINNTNDDVYLINEYHKNNGFYFLTLSPGEGNDVIGVLYDNNGRIGGIGDNTCVFRPSVALVANTQISSGNGTKENPYEIAS